MCTEAKQTYSEQNVRVRVISYDAVHVGVQASASVLLHFPTIRCVSSVENIFMHDGNSLLKGSNTLLIRGKTATVLVSMGIMPVCIIGDSGAVLCTVSPTLTAV